MVVLRDEWAEAPALLGSVQCERHTPSHVSDRVAY